MDFSLDGNRRLVTVPEHADVFLSLTSQGMTISLATWSHEAVHVVAQAMAAAGDHGVPVFMSCDKDESLAWALLFCAYGTGDPYDKCRDWVAERSGAPVDEDEAHWIMVRGMLWP